MEGKRSPALDSDRLIVVYERVSTDRQDLGRQAVQRERARIDHPARDLRIIQDDGVSAFKVSIFDRPGGRELCQLIEAGSVEALYTDAQDRLSRGRQSEWWNFADLCEQAVTRIVIDGRELRLGEEADEIRSAIDAIVARRESREKSHRVKGGLRRRAEEGRYVGSAGRRWTGRQVGKVLRSPRIAGLTSGYPLIIEPERWHRLQAALDRRKPTGRRPYGGHIFVGGVLRCPQCGSALRARTTREGHAYYECRKVERRECSQRRIDARAIEQHILTSLSHHVFDPDETRTRIEGAAAKKRREAAHMLAQAERGIHTVERKRERVKRDYLDGKLRADLYEEALATLDSDREQAEARAAELREAAASIEALAADIDVEREVFGRLERLQSVIRGSRADAEAVEEIRRALRESVARIEYEEGGSLVLAFGSREMAAKWRERKPNLKVPAAQAADAGSSINDPR